MKLKSIISWGLLLLLIAFVFLVLNNVITFGNGLGDLIYFFALASITVGALIANLISWLKKEEPSWILIGLEAVILLFFIYSATAGRGVEKTNKPNNHSIESNEIIEHKNELKIKNPIETINRIFTSYNQCDESTDSQDNLDSLTQSLILLEQKEMTEDNYQLIINVWMYYTVTDFDCRAKSLSLLSKNTSISTYEVGKRMNNKFDWESKNMAPFSELTYLLEQLNNQN